jgi:hypothetical protein
MSPHDTASDHIMCRKWSHVAFMHNCLQWSKLVNAHCNISVGMAEWLQSPSQRFLCGCWRRTPCLCSPFLLSRRQRGGNFGRVKSEDLDGLLDNLVSKNFGHHIQLSVDIKSNHCQHLLWWDAVSQGLKYVLISFDHHRCITVVLLLKSRDLWREDQSVHEPSS